jgi:hypothetical protein
MTKDVRIIGRAIGITWAYAVTLGCLYGVRMFWLLQAPHPGSFISRFHGAVEAALRTSPFIVLAGSIFAVIAIPLAAWSVGSASWSLLRKHIYGFWVVLALFILISGNADGVILISGGGLIALWLLRNLSISKASPQTLVALRIAGFKRHITIFAILAVIACSLLFFIFVGHGTKVYVSEICGLYTIACVCQGFKVFLMTKPRENVERETKP